MSVWFGYNPNCGRCGHLDSTGFCNMTACIYPCETGFGGYINKPQTNADRIRAMSDYDMADWISLILDHCENKMPTELCSQSCPLYKCCNDQPSDHIEDWLKAPADKEGE